MARSISLQFAGGKMARFRRFAAGDKFRPTASQVNAWTDAALAHRLSPQRFPPETSRPISGTHAPVGNETEDDLPAYSVLQITGPAFDPEESPEEYESRIELLGGKPTEDSAERFAVIQRPLIAGDIDPRALIHGITLARLTGPTGVSSAGTGENEYTLVAGNVGAMIIHDPGPAETERIAYVALGAGGSSLFVCYANGTATKGEMGSFYTEDGGTFIAFNNLADLGTDTRCICGRVSGQLELVQADCNGVI